MGLYEKTHFYHCLKNIIISKYYCNFFRIVLSDAMIYRCLRIENNDTSLSHPLQLPALHGKLLSIVFFFF